MTLINKYKNTRRRSKPAFSFSPWFPQSHYPKAKDQLLLRTWLIATTKQPLFWTWWFYCSLFFSWSPSPTAQHYSGVSSIYNHISSSDINTYSNQFWLICFVFFGAYSWIRKGGTRNLYSDPECKSVYGAQGGGDTCSAIIQKFTLSADFFSAINPNLNCDNIFVGQWLCINGTVN